MVVLLKNYISAAQYLEHAQYCIVNAKSKLQDCNDGELKTKISLLLQEVKETRQLLDKRIIKIMPNIEKWIVDIDNFNISLEGEI